MDTDKDKPAAKQEEDPHVLLRKAVTYLVGEIDRLSVLADDATKCSSAYSAAILVTELGRRLQHYRTAGLQALVSLTGKVLGDAENYETEGTK